MRAALIVGLALVALAACASFSAAPAEPRPPDEEPAKDAGARVDAGRADAAKSDGAASSCAPPALHCADFEGSDFGPGWSQQPNRFVALTSSSDSHRGVATVTLPKDAKRNTVREALTHDLGALVPGRYRLSYALRVDAISGDDNQDVEVSAFQVGNRNFHVNIRVENGGEQRIGFGFFTKGPPDDNSEVERSLALFTIGQWQTISVEVQVAEELVITNVTAKVDDGEPADTDSMSWNPDDKAFFIGVGALYVADIPAETKYSIDDVRVSVAGLP